jgi:hypothetical protein
MRNWRASLDELTKVERGRSRWQLDWTGSPRLRGADLEVTIHARRREGHGEESTPAEVLALTVPFEALANLNSDRELPPARWRERKPILMTGGQPYELDLAASVFAVRPVAAQASQAAGDVVWPVELSVEAQGQLHNDSVLTIADPTRSDAAFCVIPCMEVVRYFFCPSRLLARHVLSGWDHLLWADACKTRSGQPVVGLASGFKTSFRDAIWLGQYLMSAAWRDAADSVARSLRMMSHTRPATAFSCFFPLDGLSTISVEAIEVDAATPLGKRFYVTRILNAPRVGNFETCWVDYQPKVPRRQPSQAESENWLLRQPWRNSSALPKPHPRVVCIGVPSP